MVKYNHLHKHNELKWQKVFFFEKFFIYVAFLTFFIQKDSFLRWIKRHLPNYLHSHKRF